jgi:hypothetical protein
VIVAILDRDLNSSWFDLALNVARTAHPLGAAREELRESLNDVGLGSAALIKTVTALTRVWLQPADERAAYALWALKFADSTSDWRPLHVGALLVREPFVRELLTACALEARAKGEVDTVALRLRMRNVFGPKRSIDRATQRGVKTLRSLGVLQGTRSESMSRPGEIVVSDGSLAAWLVNCLLLGRGAESVAIEDLSHATELFGLVLPPTLPRAAGGVTKHAEGVGRTVLALDR